MSKVNRTLMLYLSLFLIALIVNIEQLIFELAFLKKSKDGSLAYKLNNDVTFYISLFIDSMLELIFFSFGLKMRLVEI